MTRLQARRIHRHDEIAIVAVVGELDLDSEHVLADATAAVLDAGQVQLILDCDELTFCDSRGLGLLLTLRQTLDDRGGSLILTAPGPQLLRTLELTGADQVITLAAGIGEAVSLLSPAGPSVQDASA
ncbi:STAS domain-containing protein [Streptomyces sp. H10-C2]|uniref:STAS domain-containing protein n=1 Tax=unclassified Streptomyces TaxID=2593676 RepID=UPI0024B971D7|nr:MULTISPECIES: STAS domain-containing protein [unclassified Streptomyces]MDJ0343403.1 STAS domain-containing protein [Streptomyces sp. PH10-H1]MDJ0371786.1 STAS domain-containing protein [Streptomyces sp. H10-C2]